MTDRIKTFWEKYMVQIVTVLVIAVGFYFTTTTRLDAHKEMILNHEMRIKVVEIENAKTGAILDRMEKRIDQMDKKIDKLIEGQGLK